MNIQETLNTHVVFKDLAESCKVLLSEGSHMLSLSKDEFVFKQNQKSESIFILVEGNIAITIKREERDIINGIVFPTNIFGLSDTLESRHRMKGAKIVSPIAKVIEVPKALLDQVISINPNFANKLFSLLIKNIRAAETRLDSFVFKDAKDRIIDFIKINARNTGIKVGYETLIKHPFTQQNIADYTGTSRQTVMTIFKELRSSNKITFQRKRILVRNMAEL